MKRKILSVVFLSFIFVLLFSQHAFADSPYTTSIPIDSLDETDSVISIKFTDLIPDKRYGVCTLGREQDCGYPRDWQTSSGDGVIEINLCPWGDREDLQTIDKCSGSYYFSAGRTYHVRLFSLDSNNIDTLLQDIPIPIKHFYPQVKFSAIRNGQEVTNPMPTDTYRAVISGRKPGGDERNDYALEIKRADGTLIVQQCIVVGQQTGTSVDFNRNLDIGNYKFFVKEKTGGLGGCNAGFEYTSLDFQVSPTGGSISGSTQDPKGEDLQRQLSALQIKDATNPPPCIEGEDKDGQKVIILDTDSDEDVKLKHAKIEKCLIVDTAIGAIDTDPAGFIKRIFSLLLGVSGGIAVILIIVSGYRLMASQGNPEKIQGAREMLTSAIVGLLFIIFSFVILQVIGVDILKIPGFSK